MGVMEPPPAERARRLEKSAYKLAKSLRDDDLPEDLGPIFSGMSGALFSIRSIMTRMALADRPTCGCGVEHVTERHWRAARDTLGEASFFIEQATRLLEEARTLMSGGVPAVEESGAQDAHVARNVLAVADEVDRSDEADFDAREWHARKLEARVRVFEALTSAIERWDEVAALAATAPDERTLGKQIRKLLGVSKASARAVLDLPLRLVPADERQGLVAEVDACRREAEAARERPA